MLISEIYESEDNIKHSTDCYSVDNTVDNTIENSIYNENENDNNNSNTNTEKKHPSFHTELRRVISKRNSNHEE